MRSKHLEDTLTGCTAGFVGGKPMQDICFNYQARGSSLDKRMVDVKTADFLSALEWFSSPAITIVKQ